MNGSDYDVAIIGAGISGARIYHELARQGCRALLLDRNDFAGGTSQASGMMIWGGILYLKDFDLRTVLRLCHARDQLIDQLPGKVRAASLRYLPAREGLRNRHVVRAGMMLYWLLGSLRRRFPGCESKFSESDLLKAGRFRPSLTLEEAVLNVSDCRFTLEWILPYISPEAPALNHCEMDGAIFDSQGKCWRLDLRDKLGGHEATVTARFIVNAGGAWTDNLNGRLGVPSPYRHELSKGVYISFRRPASLHHILVFDTGEHDDTTTFVPWGPVAMCGPTETRITDLSEGFTVTPEDVRLLLRMANQNLRARYGPEDIVSMRCGVRPLAVRRDFARVVHPLELSRQHLVHHDRDRRAIAVYGGKLTSCGGLAREVLGRLMPGLPKRPAPAPAALIVPPGEAFPGLSALAPSALWCRDHEHCHTLEDYLRRRTNIAQWSPRCGLGANDENVSSLRKIAQVFGWEDLAAYQRKVREHHDDILAAV